MLGVLVALSLAPQTPTVRPYLHMPSVDTFARHDPSGTTILPEGRLLTPAGTATPVARNPYGLALSPDGRQAFVASEGVGQWIDGWQSSSVVARQPDRHTNTGGCAYSPDGRTLYWGDGEKGDVVVIDVASRKEMATIPFNVSLGGHTFEGSYVNDIAPSPNGRYLYCADVTNFRLGIVDVAARRLVASVPTGRYPYVVSASGHRVFVANIGQFAYSAVGPSSDPKFDNRGLTFPPFAYPSREAERGVEVEGRKVPGLGAPRAQEAFSVYGYYVADPLSPKLVSVTKTGDQVGASLAWGHVVGGSAPSYVLATDDRVYVSNSNDDSVDVLRADSGRIVDRISLEPSPLVRGLRGVEPTGMAISADRRRLYVAESGLNAIAVVDLNTKRVAGLIPTAWYPYRVSIAPDGQTLACICFKGFGSGPNAGPAIPTDPFMHRMGSFSAIPVPADAALPHLTATVLADNGIVDASPDYPKLKSPVWSNILGRPSDQIKYVVFICKENHTFDTIFDRVPGSENDPSLLRWGLDQTIVGTGQPTLHHVAVMINHNRLARQFVVSDNFYMEPEASGVGHRWLVGIQPNNFCQMLYTLGWDFKLDSSAAGRRASFGSNGSMAPEDYPEAGAMWEHLVRHGVPFRNYGEGFEFAGVEEDAKEERTGAREVVNIPMPASLYNNTSRDFPIFNMNIPDMYRAEWFEKEVRDRYLSGRMQFPSFINIALCNDHGTDPSPKTGYPYRASWMADDDYALGDIVQFLSHTPQWKNMLILVTEDDAGGEPDHVDVQRSVLLAISPWVRHAFVSHRHTTITSMHRTMYEIFGLPPLNLFDALSNDFSDCFTLTPDFTPYDAVPVDPRLFDWPKSRSKSDPDYRQARHMPTIERDTWERDETRQRR